MDVPQVGAACGQSALPWQTTFLPVPVHVAAHAVLVTRFGPPPVVVVVSQQTWFCMQLPGPLQPMVGLLAPQLA